MAGTRSPNIVVVGSANTDLVVRTARLPKPGETVLGGEFSQVGGGKGANQAVAAARAGGRVSFVAKVGDDEFGAAAVRSYQAEGIDTRSVTRASGTASGVALILVDADGENAIAVASGANGLLSPADIDAAADAIAAADVLLIQLEIPVETVARAVDVAATAGCRVILNPAPAVPLSPDILGKVSLITPNETEAGMLAGCTVRDLVTARDTASRLCTLGPAAAVLTLGRDGCLVAGVLPQHDAAPLPPTRIASHPVTAVDTVAAGDVFNGALAVAIAEGLSLREAAAFGNAAAAIAVTRRGAQASAPRRGEIETLLKHS